jgi:uncharacterized protein (TIGR02391 family)
VVKEFTSEEIDRGIQKLRRWRAEVEALNPHRVRHSDAVALTAERNLRVTILEIFGQISPEYQTHQYHEIYYRKSEEYRAVTFGAFPEDQKYFAAGISQTVSMLQGLITQLEEKRAGAHTDPASRAKATFDSLSLHPRIIEACAEAYRNGHYQEAVFNASKALVNYVKERSCRLDMDGAPLMRAVFSANKPILVFNDLADQSDRDEQEGMMHLYEGAVLALRNRRGHSFISDSPERAPENIGFLSLLANRLEEARRA